MEYHASVYDQDQAFEMQKIFGSNKTKRLTQNSQHRLMIPIPERGDTWFYMHIYSWQFNSQNKI